MNERTYLVHYGVLGMQWGKHRVAAKASREKASKVAANRYAAISDLKRAKYLSLPVSARIVKTAASAVTVKMIKDMLTGDLYKYSRMNKTQLKKALTKKAASIVISTTANVAFTTALAKSAMKNYTDDGKVVRGNKRSNKIITKEDLIESGVKVGVHASAIGAYMGTRKLSQVASERRQNEDRFNAWGKNILPQSVDNVIWTDGDMSIIDNSKG